ncbi:MAG: FG-GAP-like repeat-containing protein, partial [Acidimicrobiales bacterium]|nr:FG-GAP-like repeat-containing protein [Acidimicrobiales bacterium]
MDSGTGLPVSAKVSRAATADKRRGVVVHLLVVSLLVALIPWIRPEAASARLTEPTAPDSKAGVEEPATPQQVFPSSGTPDDAPVRFAGATGTLMPLPDGAGGYGRTTQLVTGDVNGDLIDDVVAVRDVFNANRTALSIAMGEGDGTLAAPSFVDLDSSLTPNNRGGLDLGDFDGDGALDIAVGVRNPILTRVFLNDGAGGFVDDADNTIDLITDKPSNLFAADVDGDGTTDLLVVETVGSTRMLNFYRNLGSGSFDTGTELFSATRDIMAVDIGDLTGDGLADIALADSVSTVHVLVQRAVDADPLNNVFDDDGPETELNGGDDLAGNATQLWITPDLTGDAFGDVVIVSRDDKGCLSTVTSRACLVVAAGDGAGGLSSPEAVDADEDDLDDNGRTAPLVDTYYIDYPTTPPAPADLDGDGLLEFVISGNSPHVQVVEVDPAGAITTKRLVTGHGTGPDDSQSATVNGATNNDAMNIGDTGIVDLDLDGRLDILVGQVPGSYTRSPYDLTWLRNDPAFPMGFRTGFAIDAVQDPIDDRRSDEDTVLVDWSGDDVLDLVTFSSDLDLIVASGRGDGTFERASVVATDPTIGVAGCRSGQNSDVMDALHADDFDGDGALDLGYVSNDDTTNHLCVLYGDGIGGIASVVATAGVGTDYTDDSAEWVDYDDDGDLDALSREADGGDTTIVVYRNDADGAAFVATPVLVVAGLTRFTIGVGDIDGDGLPDLIRNTRDGAERIVHAHLQGDDGLLADTPINTMGLPESSLIAIGEMGIADFDGDGDGDLIYNHEGNQFTGRNLRSYVVTGNGDGTFTPPDVEGVNEYPLSNRNTRYHFVDLDDDGDLDVVTASYGLGVEVLVNSGEGGIHSGERFDGPFRYSTGVSAPSALFLGDLDGDNDLDAITQKSNPGSQRPYDIHTVLLQIPGAPPVGDGTVDLTVDDVVATPASVEAGDEATIEYTAANNGDGPAIGPWVDAIYLSADGNWDVNDRLLATVDRTGSLGAGVDYDGSVAVTVDPVVLGDNQIIVRVDARNAVVETDDANNTAVADAALDVTIPVVDGTLDVVVGPGEVRYAQIPAPTDVPLLLTVAGPGGGADVDVVRDAIPVPRRQLQVPDRSASERRLGLPAGDEGTWFVRVQGDVGLAGPTTYELTVVSLEFGVVSIDPDAVANNGPATVVLTGAGFTDGSEVEIDGPATVEAASTEANDDGTTLTATFDWGPLSESATEVPTGF